MYYVVRYVRAYVLMYVYMYMCVCIYMYVFCMHVGSNKDYFPIKH